jgi:uncharacterized protein YndB with AHSA1/START domain
MSEQDLTVTFTVDASPEEVVAAIVDVASWWTGEIDGESARVGDRFTYRYGTMHRSTQVVTALTPERVVWHVEDGELAFTAASDEWVGTDIEFAVSGEGNGTRVVFTHHGITPEVECFDRCSPAWGHYVGTNLPQRITSGRPALTPA